MTEYFPLDGTETLQLDGKEYTPERVYFHSGLRNAPIRVWTTDGAEIHYRPQTMELKAYELDTATQYFLEITDKDGETLRLEQIR